MRSQSVKAELGSSRKICQNSVLWQVRRAVPRDDCRHDSEDIRADLRVLDDRDSDQGGKQCKTQAS